MGKGRDRFRSRSATQNHYKPRRFWLFWRGLWREVFAPQGVSTEIEPTATQVAKLVEQMKAEKAKRVFFENMASSKLVKQLAKDAGASVGKPVYSDALSKADGPAATYVAMFRHNVALFKEAMLLNGK